MSQWADGQVREVTSEELEYQFQLTPEQFRRKLYAHARCRGLQVASHKIPTGMRFSLGQYTKVKEKTAVVSPEGRRTLFKPELLPEILGFIWEQQAVHTAPIRRKFFNGDNAQAVRYLRSMESQGILTSTRRGKYLWWSMAGVEVTDEELAARTPKPVGKPGPRLTEEERRARQERRTERQREKRRQAGSQSRDDRLERRQEEVLGYITKQSVLVDLGLKDHPADLQSILMECPTLASEQGIPNRSATLRLLHALEGDALVYRVKMGKRTYWEPV